ncbi:hypothetical protein ATK74_1793 [Propionicimonas paludicola]|uniref:Uncharacterized protein n=1 Tax=Propionicimonas paludicola TaxID=185243 RepID=A0A2A9CUD2_9ACTN|nr:hypothetical protein ATK74_1793 [Propionicimonas paludicola]
MRELGRCGGVLPMVRHAVIRDAGGSIIGEVHAGCCARQWFATGYRADGSWWQVGSSFEFRAEAESAVRAWAASERRVAA